MEAWPAQSWGKGGEGCCFLPAVAKAAVFPSLKISTWAMRQWALGPIASKEKVSGGVAGRGKVLHGGEREGKEAGDGSGRFPPSGLNGLSAPSLPLQV